MTIPVSSGYIHSPLPSVYRRGLQRMHELLVLFWRNRVVDDERAFLRRFRDESFRIAVVGMWMSAIVATTNALYRLALLKKVHVTVIPLDSLLITVTLSWLPPLLYGIWPSRFAREKYYWLITALYVFYFGRLALRILNGTTVDDASVSLLLTIIFAVLFLRLPFKHAFLLASIGTILVIATALEHFEPERSYRLIITGLATLILSLYLNWTMERRERELFQQNDAAKKAQLLAERAATEEVNQKSQAQEAARNFEAEARKNQRLLDELTGLYEQREMFIRGLHHDANQPLYALGSATYVLDQFISHHTELHDLSPILANIKEATHDLDGLMAGMHDLVVLGRYEPHYVSVSVNAILDRLSAKYAAKATAKHLRFVVRRRSDDISVWTDANAIERMLDNLLSNAIKYTLKGGVLIGAVLHGSIVRFDVWDTGVGIPPSKTTEIFKAFTRLERPGTSGVKGHGLGLAIVAMFRDKLVGHYLDMSSTPDRGTRFSISIPIASAVAVPAQPEPSRLESSVVDPARCYIVIVEDNELVRRSITSLLQQAGYAVQDNVRIARSIDELKVIFVKMPYRAPHLVICDYRLLNGETANDAMQLLDETFAWTMDKIPLLIMSAEITPPVDTERPLLRVINKTANAKGVLSAITELLADAKLTKKNCLSIAQDNAESG